MIVSVWGISINSRGRLPERVKRDAVPAVSELQGVYQGLTTLRFVGAGIVAAGGVPEGPTYESATTMSS